MKKKNDSKIYEEWFVKGNHDLNSAEIIFKEEGFTDTICFLCQQAAEKYLKGYLMANRKLAKKIHDLAKLVDDCCAMDKSFKQLLPEANFLNVFYIESRYPPDPPVIYPRALAGEAIKAAQKMIKFVTEKLTE